MNLVIDCSFMMANVLPDEEQHDLESILSGILNRRYIAYVPSVFYLECNNVIINSLRRKRIDQDFFELYAHTIGQLPLKVDNFSSTVESVYALGKISEKYNLSSYDASYFELAKRMDAEIVTFDKQLRKACKEAKLKLLNCT